MVPASRKSRHLVEVFGEPWRFFGEVDKAVLDHRGLRVHAPDLVRLWLIAGDRVQAALHQFLDQLGARRLVLDQHDSRIESSRACSRTARFSSGYSMSLRNPCP